MLGSGKGPRSRSQDLNSFQNPSGAQNPSRFQNWAGPSTSVWSEDLNIFISIGSRTSWSPRTWALGFRNWMACLERLIQSESSRSRSQDLNNFQNPSGAQNLSRFQNWVGPTTSVWYEDLNIFISTGSRTPWSPRTRALGYRNWMACLEHLIQYR